MPKSSSPNDRKFTKTHEWVKIEGEKALVGISGHAQESLGDITFVELPAIGKKVFKAQSCSVIESVKAASDIYAPVSGEIAEVNTSLETAPEAINKDPYQAGWLFSIKNFNAADTADLMDAAAYDAFAESEK
ncbi:MAG TPA: glycine cleavage system protein GcvH [Chitinivibrionales bacterium]|nr:glycine cleavage system protein GcvH [Chitinivibrionales bacterium]